MGSSNDGRTCCHLGKNGSRSLMGSSNALDASRHNWTGDLAIPHGEFELASLAAASTGARRSRSLMGSSNGLALFRSNRHGILAIPHGEFEPAARRRHPRHFAALAIPHGEFEPGVGNGLVKEVAHSRSLMGSSNLGGYDRTRGEAVSRSLMGSSNKMEELIGLISVRLAIPHGEFELPPHD